MKLKDLFEHTDMYQIISHTILDDDSAVDGTSKQGSVIQSYDNLVRLFGQPKQVKGDYSNEWIVKFEYQSKPQLSQNDVDTVVVVIYTTSQDLENNDNWTVGGHTMVSLWVLEQFLEHNQE